MNALGVDVSHWHQTVDWQQLKAAGVCFAVVKASGGVKGVDPLLRTHFSGARDAGMVTGVFHWVDPTEAARQQVDHFLETCSGLDYDFAALDVEQQWQSWQEWAVQKIVHIIPPERISAHARETAETLRASIAKQVVIYTRTSFVQDYARPMQTWLPEWPLWLAYYPYPRGRVTVSWEDLFKKYSPRIAGPRLPQGCKDWRFWQFSGDRFVLPGAASPLDLNSFNGDEAMLRAWLEEWPAAPQEITDAEKLSRLWDAHPELRWL
ncbi:MAG: GH25 family lysozyme [Bellilinea sp.]